MTRDDGYFKKAFDNLFGERKVMKKRFLSAAFGLALMMSFGTAWGADVTDIQIDGGTTVVDFPATGDQSWVGVYVLDATGSTANYAQGGNQTVALDGGTGYGLGADIIINGGAGSTTVMGIMNNNIGDAELTVGAHNIAVGGGAGTATPTVAGITYYYEDADFSGSITGTGSLSVTGVASTTNVTGLMFYDGIDGADMGGTINFTGDITVDGESSTRATDVARAMWAKDVTGKVTLGDILVTNTAAKAYGVDVGNIDAGANTFTTGDISVGGGTGQAVGFKALNVLSAIDGGDVDVEATGNGPATGIVLESVGTGADVTYGDFDVTAEDGVATGFIVTGDDGIDATVTLGNNNGQFIVSSNGDYAIGVTAANIGVNGKLNFGTDVDMVIAGKSSAFPNSVGAISIGTVNAGGEINANGIQVTDTGTGTAFGLDLNEVYGDVTAKNITITGTGATAATSNTFGIRGDFIDAAGTVEVDAVTVSNNNVNSEGKVFAARYATGIYGDLTTNNISVSNSGSGETYALNAETIAGNVTSDSVTVTRNVSTIATTNATYGILAKNVSGDINTTALLSVINNNTNASGQVYGAYVTDDVSGNIDLDIGLTVTNAGKGDTFGLNAGKVSGTINSDAAITINNNNAASTGSVFAANAGAVTGDITVKGVTVNNNGAGSTGTTYGIQVGSLTKTGTHGLITADGPVSILNNGTTSTADVFAARVLDKADGAITTTNTVKVENKGTGNTYGIIAKSLGTNGVITAQNTLTVIGKTNDLDHDVIGVGVADAVDGKISTQAVNVTNNGTGNGYTAGIYLPNGNMKNTAGGALTDTLAVGGKITVQGSASGNADGIYANQLTGTVAGKGWAISQEIEVTTGGDAHAIHTFGGNGMNSTLDIVQNVNLKATGGSGKESYSIRTDGADDTLNFAANGYNQKITTFDVENVNFKNGITTTIADGSKFDQTDFVTTEVNSIVNLAAEDVFRGIKQYTNNGKTKQLANQTYENLTGTGVIDLNGKQAIVDNTIDTVYNGDFVDDSTAAPYGDLVKSGPATLTHTGQIGEAAPKHGLKSFTVQQGQWIGENSEIYNTPTTVKKDATLTATGDTGLWFRGAGSKVTTDNGGILKVGSQRLADGTGDATLASSFNADASVAYSIDKNTKLVADDSITQDKVKAFNNLFVDNWMDDTANGWDVPGALQTYLDSQELISLNKNNQWIYQNGGIDLDVQQFSWEDGWKNLPTVLDSNGALDFLPLVNDNLYTNIYNALTLPADPTWTPAQVEANKLLKLLGRNSGMKDPEGYSGYRYATGMDLANTLEAVQDTAKAFTRAIGARAYNLGVLTSCNLDECGQPLYCNTPYRTRIWAGYSGLWGKAKDRGGDRGYSYDANGFNVGIDHLTASGFAFGTAFGYSKGKYELRSKLWDDSNIDNYSFGLYGSYNHASGFFATLMGQYTYSDYDINSQFSNSLTAGYNHDHANYESNTWSIGGALGWDIKATNRFTITPSIGIYYYDTVTKDFNTYNNLNTINRYDMKLKREAVEMPIDVTLKYDVCASDNTKVSLVANGGYSYNMKNKGTKVEEFNLGGVSVEGDQYSRKPGASTWYAGGGIQASIKNFDFAVNYQYTGRYDYNSHNVTANVGVKF